MMVNEGYIRIGLLAPGNRGVPSAGGSCHVFSFTDSMITEKIA